MSILEVKDLCKNYPQFSLKNVSFSLEQGKITGFIGRNGAGKTTTLKSIFGLIHPDGGSVRFFDKDFAHDEAEIKQKTALVSGGIDHYLHKKLKSITAVTRMFYTGWSDSDYNLYMREFGLSEDKTPSELSAGMKVKYSLAVALSQGAKLLVLDEPTSGLDPVSREELLQIFMGLQDRGATILFSTHITSDLEKCADNIIYLKNGSVMADSPLRDFASGYRIIETGGELPAGVQPLGRCRTKTGYSYLVKSGEAGENSREATLDEIMVHLESEAILNDR